MAKRVSNKGSCSGSNAVTPMTMGMTAPIVAVTGYCDSISSSDSDRYPRNCCKKDTRPSSLTRANDEVDDDDDDVQADASESEEEEVEDGDCGALSEARNARSHCAIWCGMGACAGVGVDSAFDDTDDTAEGRGEELVVAERVRISSTRSRVGADKDVDVPVVVVVAVGVVVDAFTACTARRIRTTLVYIEATT